jgi:hypothetical protein
MALTQLPVHSICISDLLIFILTTIGNMTATTAISSPAQMTVNVPVLKRQGSRKRSNSLQKLVKVARRISGSNKKSGSKRNVTSSSSNGVDKKMDAVAQDKVIDNAVKSVGSAENSDVRSVSMTVSTSFDDDDAADDFPLESPSPARTTRQISNLDLVSPSSLRPVLETEESKAEPAPIPWVPSMETEEDVDSPAEQVQEQENLKATYVEVLKELNSNFSKEQEYVKDQFSAEEAPVVKEQVPVEEAPVVKEQVPVEEAPVVKEQVPVEEAPLFEEQVPVEEAPVVKEQVPVEEAPVVKEQVPVEEAPVVKEQVPVEEAPLFEEQVHVEEVPVVKEQVPVEEAPIFEEQVPVEEAPVVKEQVSVEEVPVVVAKVTSIEDALAPLTDAEYNTDGMPRGVMIEAGIMVAVMAGIYFWNPRD